MTNYVIENEQQVLAIYADWDRRKENLGRAEGDRRKAHTDALIETFFWSAMTLVITVAWFALN